MLHLWLVPSLIILAVVIGIFYLTIRFRGGSGIRSEGRTVHDEPGEEDNPPPS